MYKWAEYLLFNPYNGYRFLVCMDGHWSYVVKTKSAPKVDKVSNTAEYLTHTYQLFHKGKVKTLFVLGEFYWKVKANDIVDAKDYIRPPEILSMEKDSDEEIWSVGEYVPKKDIEKSFNLSGLMPLEFGVAPHQPSPHQDGKQMKAFVSYLVTLLLIIQFVFIVVVNRTEVFNQTYNVPNPKGHKFQTASFTVADKIGYVEAQLRADVSNGWFEYTADVVREDKDAADENYEFDQGVEYYFGSDSDGYWSEGSRETDRRIAKLDPGKYHLDITTEAGSSSPVEFNVIVSQGNISWGNFLFAFLLLCIYPIYYVIKASKFEKERWSQSDHSPYWNENSDD